MKTAGRKALCRACAVLRLRVSRICTLFAPQRGEAGRGPDCAPGGRAEKIASERGYVRSGCDVGGLVMGQAGQVLGVLAGRLHAFYRLALDVRQR